MWEAKADSGKKELGEKTRALIKKKIVRMSSSFTRNGTWTDQEVCPKSHLYVSPISSCIDPAAMKVILCQNDRPMLKECGGSLKLRLSNWFIVKMSYNFVFGGQFWSSMNPGQVINNNNNILYYINHTLALVGYIQIKLP